MQNTTLRPHIREQNGRRPLLVSVTAHLALLATITLGSTLCQPGLDLEAGDSRLPGGARAFPVSLTAELTGGTGNVAPALTPAPEAVKPPPPREEPQPVAELPKFADPHEDLLRKSKDAPTPTKPQYTQDPTPGAIPGKARPGVGGSRGGAARLGTRDRTGTGLRIGSGGGRGAVPAWYVRQLEQRIAINWLRASLGGVTARVVTRISFTIAPNGQIQNVQIVESSRNRGVDRAALRAIRASSPLAPLPIEVRGRLVEFVAYFEYPPT